MPYKEIIIGVIIFILAVAAFKLFKAPLKLLLKIIVNTGLGFLGLLVINTLSVYTGISLGLNFVNAVIIGLFGLPGFALLLFLNILFP